MSILHPSLIQGSKKHVLSMTPYQTAKPLVSLKSNGQRSSILNLASNESPHPPSDAIQSLLHASWHTLHRYPDPTGIELKTMIAEQVCVTVEQVTLTNGSSEAIALLLQLFAGPGDEVIIAETAYALYETCIQTQGAQARKIPDNQWVHDLVAMQQAVTPQTKMILLANPNNPTGTYVKQDALKKLLETTPKHVIIVVDEAYFEYVTHTDYPQSLKLQQSHENLVVTRSFSKVYALAGLRVGYCLAHPTISNLLNRIRLSFNMNSIALAVATLAFQQTDYVKQAVAFVRTESEKMQAQLNQLGILFLPPSANFIMMAFQDNADQVFNHLLEQGVLIRQLHNYQLPHHLRVSIGTAEENDAFIQALSRSIPA